MRTGLDERVLLVTERGDLSADLLIAELVKQRVAYVRWNVEDFPAASTLTWNPEQLDVQLATGATRWSLSDIKSAWYRRTPRPQREGTQSASVADFINRETSAFLSGVFETSGVPWMNRPSHVQRAENKLTQLALARECGFLVPRTLVTNDPKAARRFVTSVPRAIAKTLGGGTIHDNGTDFALFTHTVTAEALTVDAAVQAAPCIFQEQMVKGFDIRVTVVGKFIFATRIATTHDEVDWRAADRRAVQYHMHRIPEELERRCHVLMQRLGLIYGCLDFVLTPAGEYAFLEINPSGQWGWIDEETHSSITQSIVRLLINADFQ
ncbi:MvdC/MvdD family ATP grasp protein [Paraburkholderia sp. DHOC27]|uniref:MvdC/MvdD family ATP grasp protein n=1 Tax=Paraburkholderia sp. DHOC27 TaxID=2303330 RepID=UPI000E3E0109|nr:hypothetical protein [Paraburkholderia sp. DHOC27]RFU49587.1 hypothetical protein D0B32_07325 [Paraburkholderia sp. DHOC27]